MASFRARLKASGRKEAMRAALTGATEKYPGDVESEERVARVAIGAISRYRAIIYYHAIQFKDIQEPIIHEEAMSPSAR